MPAIKHPCPHCGKWIMRDVAACPFCGTADPFAPARCPSCRAVIEDRAWVACPTCGTPLSGASGPGAIAGAGDDAGATPPSAGSTGQGGAGSANLSAPPPASASVTCTGCGAPLAAGARFCAVCGTLAG